ncbi:low molecular weight protein-tyrosine-phosphatase [Coraliomargarita parva]|uniref:low molecular weight protein-tyrosine-phosphatase n=1 Tax=Coraliomargarita parva TaxID=3014050 RepID=UPI0022B5CC9F|nr:low molecular weight protein-tyrosine-phosphatase [Coraliomargarita parva]
MTRILFLCMGNICRSPAAHCVFQHLVNEAGLTDRFEIESAGTIGFHVGEPPDGRMQAVMRQRSIPIIGRSRLLQAEDLDYYDLILAMDKDNLRDAQGLVVDEARKAKVRLFCEYCRNSRRQEVPDPYYGGARGFEDVLDLIEDGCAGLLDALK